MSLFYHCLCMCVFCFLSFSGVYLIISFWAVKLARKYSRTELNSSCSYIRDSSLLNVCFPSKNCPSVRCTPAANIVCRDVVVSGIKTISVYHIL
jgi:hypothetical protein